MSTRAEFVQKAVAAGLTPDKIKLAMNDRRSKVGAFDDDAATAATPVSAAPTVAAPAPLPAQSFGSQVKEVARIAFPTRVAYGEGPQRPFVDGLVGGMGANYNDVMSMPRRIFGAGVELAQGNPAGAKREMLKTEGEGVLEDITREAPMMFLNAGKVVGGSVISRIGSAMAQGAKQAAPSALGHQAERVTAGGNVDAREFASELATGGGLPGAFHGAGEGISRIMPAIKQGVSKLSEVSKEALDAVTDRFHGKANMAAAKRAANKFGNEDGGTDLIPMAEEIAQRVGTENAARTAAVDGQRAAQRIGMEQNLLAARAQVVPTKVGRIGDISSGYRGEEIKGAIENAKPIMQKTYIEGDNAAYGGLRQAPAETKMVERFGFDDEASLMPDGKGGLEEGERLFRKITEEIPMLPGRIDEVLAEFKALTPAQGVAKITPGATRAIKAMGSLAQSAKTVDDLVDLRWQIRHLQASGGYEGALFDATRDDVALAKVMAKVREVETASIKLAAGKRAPKILELVGANDALYGKTVEVLRKGDLKFRATQNTENIIAKVKQMGPEEARALMNEAKTNKTLKPYVLELQRGFVDDLLMSSMKGGDFDGAAMAKAWSGVSNDIKYSWLPTKMIKSIDAAIAKGTKEIADADLVGEGLFGPGVATGPEALKYAAEKKLGNIETAAQKKAKADLIILDGIFGSKYTDEAIGAFRAKQLGITESGDLPSMGRIRTGKASTMVAALGGNAGTGAVLGTLVGGAPGAAVGSIAGLIGGFYLQSPAGAVAVFNILNRLEAPSAARAAAKHIVNQATRSAAFTPDTIKPINRPEVGRIEK